VARPLTDVENSETNPTDFNNQATKNQLRHAVRDLAKSLSVN
jgi:hypothetical protein